MTTPRTCPACDEPVPPNAAVCPACGAQLPPPSGQHTGGTGGEHTGGSGG